MLWSALSCVGIKKIIQTHVREAICCCVGVCGGLWESRVHSCVIVSLTALVLVYCKHPHASHYLSFPLSAVTPSQHVALGRFLFVEACTHMQEHLLMHTGMARSCTLTHMHANINYFLPTPTQIVPFLFLASW